MFSLQKISVIVFILLFPAVSAANDIYRAAAGAREAGMGYLFIAPYDLFTSFHNQASLAYNRSFLIGFNHENRFGLIELSTRSAGFAVPAGKASIGGFYSHFGYPDYNRQMAGLACGLLISKRVAAGVQADYYAERPAGEDNSIKQLTVETGILISLSESTFAGIHIFNPVPNSLRKSDIPSRLRIGAGTTLGEGLFAGLEAEIVTGRNPDLKIGFEYEAVNSLWLRSGFSTLFSKFSFGLGYRSKPAMIDIAFSTHERLGISSSISIIFTVK